MTEEQLSTIWKSVLLEMEGRFSPATCKTWFKHSRLLNLKPEGVEVAVENAFAQNFIQKYAEPAILESLSQHSKLHLEKIQYAISPQPKTNRVSSKAPTPSKPSPQLFQERATTSSTATASNLNPRYTFDTFIVGNRNRLAYAAARAVAEQPGRLYNPLYLYGGVGLGKTHLMQAVGNEVIRRDPEKRVLYASCETFMNEFVTSIQRGKQGDFKNKYRNVDVFLVDDIQFIVGKESTHEEFFHTFNALYQTNKQIIITSDKVPSDIKGLEERLASRFSSGMIADMQLPDLETRQAILRSKCQERGVVLPDEILLYIADQIETNIRELEGALTTVILHIEASHTSPNIEMVREVLKPLTSIRRPLQKTSFEQICTIVCEFYSTSFSDIQGPRRQKELVKPRQILMYLLKHELGMTFPTIGRQIGGRDHTTAMHSVEKIEKEMKKSPELLDELQRIKELFYVGSR